MRLFLLACVLLQSSLLQTPPHMPLSPMAIMHILPRWFLTAQMQSTAAVAAGD